MNPRKVCHFHRFGSRLDFYQHGRERRKSHSADFDDDDDLCLCVSSQFLDLVLDLRTHNSLGEIEADCRNQEKALSTILGECERDSRPQRIADRGLGRSWL